MKTLYKTLKVLVFTLLFSQMALYAQNNTSLDCESGNKNIDQLLCWKFQNINYTTTSLISGTVSAITNTLSGGSNNPCGIESPWIKFDGTGTIKFKMRLDILSTLFGRDFVLQKVDTNNVVENIYTHNFNLLQSLTVVNPTVNINFTGVYKLRFYFYGLGGLSRAIIDDINISGEYWSNPSNNCQPKPIYVDTDGDGINDNLDAFPNDATKAFINYYPSANNPGTLLFEDLWPRKGDYDLNDVVIQYKIAYITNAQNNLVELQIKSTTKALGGGDSNGFIYQLDNIASSKIISVSGSKLTGSSWVNLSANGTESGQTFANIIIFDNGNKTMPNLNGNITNVNPSQAFVTPDTVNVIVKFRTDGANATNVNQLSFNPYLVKSLQRDIEIHLPKFVPSSKANRSYFKTYDDDSSTNGPKYYQTANNLPWALDINTAIPHTIESTDFTLAYTKFTQWVISGGTQYADWYMDKPGYRNNTLLYQQ